ncbi:MAG: phospholipase, partial [Chloroflexi bacterium]|nr:phospholipase [Chloroflexota bacterium]
MEGPHQNQPLLSAGAAPEKARAALLLVHGRGATAASILSLADEFQQDEFLYLAPQAGGNTWYPYSFLSPITSNEPGLSSGLAAVGAALAQVEAA